MYNGVLFLLFLLMLPKLLWQMLVHGKYRKSIAARLGITLPCAIGKNGEGPVIWIHAVSVGETRAAIPLVKEILKSQPDAVLVLSSTTETGHAEAKRSIPEAACHFFLPLDFSWTVRRMLSRIRPDQLILMESDFWYNLLYYTKKSGASILLANGKISERSLRSFKRVPFFTKKIFPLFDLLCVQSVEYAERFAQLGVPPEKLRVTGNLKLDIAPIQMSREEKSAWREQLGLSEDDRVVVVGSTHEPEEQQILEIIEPLLRKIPSLKVLLVPRHPERFSRVAALLKQRGESRQVLLIDRMGQLSKCYAIADIALVGGSFISHVGGHNIFEPVSCGVPVLFGPHMQSQKDLVEIILSAGAGQQLSLQELPGVFETLLDNKELWEKMHASCLKLVQQVRGSAHKTFLPCKKNA